MKKSITYMGESPRTIERLATFQPGVAQTLDVSEELARCLAGKGFTVEDPEPAAPVARRGRKE